jgi:hypothetical protein
MCNPFYLPSVARGEFYMGPGTSINDTMKLGMEARGGNADPIELAKMGYTQDSPTRNSGSAFGMKETWQRIFEANERNLAHFRSLFGEGKITWQCLLAAEADRLGILEELPQEFCAHDHSPIELRGLHWSNGELFTSAWRHVQIIHRFPEVKI